jgi:uncharacterized protein YidB (DUF937 family)
MDSLSSIRMDVSSIGGAQFAGSQSAPPANNPVMNGAAQALGMNSSDLISALQSGQSLSSIASSKGLSQDKLVAAMAASIQQANPGVSADQATKVATAMATRTPPAGGMPPVQTDGATGTSAAGGHHHHHGHKAVSAAMDSVASLLGTTTTDLATATQSGQSLTQIASSKGVSQQSLVSAIATALQGSDSSMSTSQATQLATALATGTPQNNQTQPWSTASTGTPSTFSVSA